MKVLLTSHLFPNAADPVLGTFVQEEARFLRKHCEIQLVSPIPWFPRIRGFGRWSQLARIPYREHPCDIHVIHPRYVTLPRRFFFSSVGFFYLATLARTGRGLDVDLIHAHMAYPDGFAAVLFGAMVGKPVVITTHGSDIDLYPAQSRIWRTLTVRALSHADRVIAVSHALRRKIEAFGIEARRIQVIPNGVDTVLFRPLKEAQAGQPVSSKNLKRILYVGGILPEKGVGVLLEAMALLSSQRNDLELVLVGANRMRSQDQMFMDQAERLSISGRTTFIEAVPMAHIPAWLASCDVFVSPSLQEGFGLSIVEALSCGKPVVATRCGGPEDIVTDNVGRLVEPGDPKGLAEAITHILDQPQNYDPVKITRYAHATFGLEAIVHQIVDLYLSTLDEWRKSRTAYVP